LEKIFRFLNVPATYNKTTILNKRNVSGDSSAVPPSTSKQLGSFYSEPNKLLFNFLGHDLNW
jgi:hypothetical protein